MRLIAILTLLALLIMPCIAVKDTVITGPYKISFDLGIPKEAYKVDVAIPEKKESLSGDVSTTYTVKLTNKTGIGRTASVILTSYETDQVVPTQDELVLLEKSVLSQIDGLYDIQAAGRKIDGADGAVASGKFDVNYGPTVNMYSAAYYLSSTTLIGLISSYPWDKETLQLLKTIDIQKSNTTT